METSHVYMHGLFLFIYDFDFMFANGAPKEIVNQLVTLASIERKKKMILLSSSGIGKIDIPSALGYKAAQASLKTRFMSAFDNLQPLILSRFDQKAIVHWQGCYCLELREYLQNIKNFFY